MDESPPVTQLLLQWTNGNEAALQQLVPLAYRELHRLASSCLRREPPGNTLQPTALVHEAYLRLVDHNLPNFRNRSHFFGVAAHLIRQILVDRARQHLSHKRGGSLRKMSIEDAVSLSSERSSDLVALDDALTSLAAVDPRASKIVELRFLAGLNVEE